MKSLSVFFSDCRMRTLIQSQRSGRTTLKRRCDLPVALLVTMTYANMRCLLKLCNKAEVLETSGAHAYQTCSCGQASLVLVVLETLFSHPGFLLLLVPSLEVKVLDLGGRVCTEMKAMMISTSDKNCSQLLCTASLEE